MGNPKGFLEVKRKEGGNRPVSERILDFSEVEQTLDEEDRRLQASRCMDCGVPFCQWGCPVMNNMPEWQDAIYRGDWQAAINILQATNNFPEFTGRICPAPCEKACTLNIHKEPVTIRENEAATAERAFERGLIKPQPPAFRTGKKVAVIGSGPAGMACADLLNKAGHHVTLFEKDDSVGGLLRFGIPDFKLAKNVIDRRVQLMMEEGLVIRTSVHVGKDISAEELLNEFDAVCLAIGAMKPRDLPVEGRDLKGIYFAMDYLTQQNKVVRGDQIAEKDRILATGKKVLVIGGGDTGSDCVGTANRQKAKSVTQIEILPKPPEERTPDNPWPYWANVLKVSSSHEEGCERFWSLSTKRFVGKNGSVTGAEVVEVAWEKDANGKMLMKEIPGTKRIIPADLVLLSLGFLHPVQEGLLKELELKLTERGNVHVSRNHQTSKAKIFAAGDAVNGATLVVHAIASGRRAAQDIDRYLQNL
ncbi:MAG TPA: glutamate synthase subunit beta [Bacteroidales bacterium]|nr:glutamate synthase subunit beta [Bacteroidales bacterium]